MDCEKALLFYSKCKIEVGVKKLAAEQFGLRTAGLNQRFSTTHFWIAKTSALVLSQ